MAEHAPPPARRALARVLAPVSVDGFFETAWERTPLLISRDDPGYFADLPSLAGVDEVITLGSCSAPGDGQLVKTLPDGATSRQPFPTTAGGRPDVHTIYRRYGEGHTVVVNRVHRSSPAVARLAHLLELDLRHPVGANLYLTPPGAQGFAPHVDTHDVFVLQLHGTKEWTVADPAEPDRLPLATSGRAAVELVDPVRLTLSAGDTLYLPRGVPHAAATASGSSLHLTVGVHVLRWIDLMAEALAVAAEADVAFRRSLGPAQLDVAATPSERADQVGTPAADLAQRLAEAVRDPQLVERVVVRMSHRLLSGDRVWGGHFPALDAVAGLSDVSVLTRPPGMPCQVRTTATEAILEFAGNHVSGPLLIEAALRQIAEQPVIVVGELPGELSPADRVDLAARLVGEGLLVPADPIARHGS